MSSQAEISLVAVPSASEPVADQEEKQANKREQGAKYLQAVTASPLFLNLRADLTDVKNKVLGKVITLGEFKSDETLLEEYRTNSNTQTILEVSNNCKSMAMFGVSLESSIDCLLTLCGNPNLKAYLFEEDTELSRQLVKVLQDTFKERVQTCMGPMPQVITDFVKAPETKDTKVDFIYVTCHMDKVNGSAFSLGSAGTWVILENNIKDSLYKSKSS